MNIVSPEHKGYDPNYSLDRAKSPKTLLEQRLQAKSKMYRMWIQLTDSVV